MMSFSPRFFGRFLWNLLEKPKMMVQYLDPIMLAFQNNLIDVQSAGSAESVLLKLGKKLNGNRIERLEFLAKYKNHPALVADLDGIFSYFFFS